MAAGCSAGDFCPGIHQICGLEKFNEPSAPFALRPRASTAARTFVPEHDAAFLQIVRRHFDANPVANDRPDAKFAHLASRIGDDPMVVFKHYAKTTIGQDFVDLAFEGQKLLFGHTIRPLRY